MNFTTDAPDEEQLRWSEEFLAWCRWWIPNVLALILLFFGMIGNGVTIIVLTRKRMRGSTNVYLTALAVVDLLFLLIYFSVVQENNKVLNSPDYLFYWEYLRLGIWLHDALGGASTWLTVSFTFERCIVVHNPLKGKVTCTESRARKVIAVVITLCFILTITTPFEKEIEMRVDPKTNVTSFIHISKLGADPTYRTVFYWFTCIVFVLIPFLLLSGMNFYLIKKVKESTVTRKKLTQMTLRKMYREKQENKITMALIGVVFLFLVCQAPTAITLIISKGYDPPIGTNGYNVMRAVGNICNFLVATYTACNFLLYCAMSDKYRQTMYRLFCPKLATRHERANTFTSSMSFRNSSVH